MLIINEELLEIEDAIDTLVANLLKTPEYKNCCRLKKIFESDQALQKQLADFKDLKDRYEEASRYADFHPETKDLKRALLFKKRQLDLNPLTVEFRYAEVDFQKHLAKIAQKLAKTVSSSIFVDSGLPLAPKRERPSIGIYQNIKEKDM
ncbi:YlbF family regulator [Streptococcus catagoni]|uniref:YlbF family regulator n=1 Tax=Streptococcus catagoni TaxID=2654874 RepID=UPI001407648C|nr:YlbF family regulator [Streptococcus catagoni]